MSERAVDFWLANDPLDVEFRRLELDALLRRVLAYTDPGAGVEARWVGDLLEYRISTWLGVGSWTAMDMEALRTDAMCPSCGGHHSYIPDCASTASAPGDQ